MGEVNLPNGWAMVTLGELADETVDRSGPASNEFIYVDISSVDRERKCISDAKISESTAAPSRAKQVLENGDIVISMTRPNLNAVAMVSPEFHGAIGSTGFHILRSKWVEPKFLFYLVQTREFIDEMCLCVQGALYPAVRPKDISSFAFFLPSSLSQHRIVAKIEELFSELDKGIESLKSARAQLKVYRQSLLKYAFEGKLTAQWRAENRDKLETAAALLKRIQAERAQRYQQQLADWEAAGKQGSKPKALKNLPPLTAEELADLPELPTGWGWVKIGDTAETNVGFAFKSSEFSSSGIRLLRGENIEPRQLRWADTRFWPSECSDEFNALLVKAGEIIIAMDRPVISSGLKVTRVKQSDIPCLLVQRVARIKEQQGLCTSYIFSAIDQNRFINHCLGNQTGTQLPHISEAQIRAYPVPLCAYEEQALISQELDSRMSEVDQLNQTITTSLQQAEALRQSILKKAFSGQLVQQDPHDESASALLARIKAEKSAQAHTKKVRT